MNWNPFKKKAEPFVWVHADPDHPHVGIAIIREVKPEQRPVFKVTGVDYVRACQRFCGKVIEWDRVHGMKKDEKEVAADVFERWFR